MLIGISRKSLAFLLSNKVYAGIHQLKGIVHNAVKSELSAFVGGK